MRDAVVRLWPGEPVLCDDGTGWVPVYSDASELAKVEPILYIGLRFNEGTGEWESQ